MTSKIELALDGEGGFFDKEELASVLSKKNIKVAVWVDTESVQQIERKIGEIEAKIRELAGLVNELNRMKAILRATKFTPQKDSTMR